jgi:hypothetical protein
MIAVLLQQATTPDATQTSSILFGCVLFAALLMFYVLHVPADVHGSGEKTRLAYLYERKDVVYDNLRDLNFEYKAGKLGEEDYATMRASMEDEAAALLSEIEQLDRFKR